ncbi:diguanylate cyclase [Oceanisphaera sp. IT1-181]|uniref:diguanylate cyclase n=1 Tax=Oceanisphaera sp. IT1-181 TaxID=3081199 RepID=UPI0029CA97AC|nr:diguanylate cyclase [Oceanisphaera sp. IT1-181]
MNSAFVFTVTRRFLTFFRLTSYPLWIGLLLLLLGHPLKAAAAQVPLTVTERAYISAHPVLSVCVDPDWLPFEGIDSNQQHVGIIADLLPLVASKTGLQIQLHPTKSWDESLLASKSGECLALSALNQTPERDQWLIFTDPLLEDPNVLITRDDHPFISDIASLNNQTIALPHGTAMAELFARDFPNLTIIYTDSEPQAMQMVSDGKVDLTLRSLIIAAHTIKNAGWYNLKVSGQVPGYGNQLRIGISQSEQTLRTILNRGIAALSEQERQQIMDRYLSLQVVSEVVTDYTLAYGLGILLLGVIGTSLFWMRRLNALNQQLSVMAQTDALTLLTNRHGLNLTLEKDLERAQRYQHPLSVMMMDIDHFKRVNDQYGHLTGDKVLVACSQLLKDNLRKSDIICRWGGEEFLVLCFETTQEQAAHLAELLLEKVRQHHFPEVGGVTMSAGVAQANPQDNAETLTKRADTLLYEAKHQGRDRVCVDQGNLDPMTDNPESNS